MAGWCVDVRAQGHLVLNVHVLVEAAVTGGARPRQPVAAHHAVLRVALGALLLPGGRVLVPPRRVVPCLPKLKLELLGVHLIWLATPCLLMGKGGRCLPNKFVFNPVTVLAWL